MVRLTLEQPPPLPTYMIPMGMPTEKLYLNLVDVMIRGLFTVLIAINRVVKDGPATHCTCNATVRTRASRVISPDLYSTDSTLPSSNYPFAGSAATTSTNMAKDHAFRVIVVEKLLGTKPLGFASAKDRVLLAKETLRELFCPLFRFPSSCPPVPR